MPGLYFDATVDMKQLERDLRLGAQSVQDFVRTNEAAASKIDSLYKNAATAVAAYFSFDAVKGLTSDIIDVRGEMQQLSISFTTMLGSKDAADRLLAQVVMTAAKTPFSLTDLAQGTKQLLAYGESAKTVNSTLVRLGNISAGLSVPIDRLIMAYGQVQAKGKLMGDDMRQFTEAGIPMIGELAKKFGVAESEISKMVESGKVGFNDVKDVINNMTNAGGKFYNLMEAQADSLPGRISNLGDSIDQMFNKMGADNQETIEGVIDALGWMVDNYQEFINILKIAVATYGTYKAAVIAVSIAEKVRYQITLAQMASTQGLTTLQALQAVVLGKVKDAQAMLNKTMLANPYVAAATAITALVATLILFANTATAAERAAEKLGEINKDASDGAKEEQNKIDALVATIRSEVSTREQKNAALKKLNDIMPDNLGYITEEAVRTGRATEAIDTYIRSVERQIKIDAIREEIKKSQQRVMSAGKDISLASTVWNTIKSGGNAAISQAAAIADIAGSESQYQQSLMKDLKKLTEESIVIDNKVAQAKARTISVIDEEIKQKKEEQQSVAKTRQEYEAYEQQIKKLEAERDAISGGKKTGEKAEKLRQQMRDTIEKDVWDTDADWQKEREKNIDKLLDSMLDGDTKSIDDFIKKEEALAEKFASIYEGSMSYDQKLGEINRKYTDSIKVMTDAGMLDNVKELRKKWQIEINSLNEGYLQEYDRDTKFFSNLYARGADMSKKTLSNTIGDVKKLIAFVKKESTDLPNGITKEAADKLNLEELVPLYQQLNDLQDELDERSGYPFKNIVKGFKELKDSSELYRKSLKTINEEQREIDQNEARLIHAKGMQSLKNGATEAAGVLNMVSDAIARIAEASGSEKMKEAAAQFGAFSSLTSSTAQGFASGGPWGAVASGVTSILSQTAEAFAQDAAEQAEYLQSKVDFANKLKLLELSLKPTDYESIFGIESIRKAREAYKLAQEALDDYYTAVNSKMAKPGEEKEYNNAGAAIYNPVGLGVFGGGKSLTNEFKVLMEAYKKGYTELQGLAIKTKDRSGWANFWGKKDQFKALKDYAPELWGSDGVFSVEKAKAFLATDKKINEEQRKKIQNVIDLKEAYDANMELVRQDISDTFGGLGSEVTNSIVDAIKNGTNAWDSFTKAGASSLETLGKKIAFELFFSDKFDKLQKDLEETYGSGADSEAIGKQQAEILSMFFGNIKADMSNAQSWMEEWKKQSESMGFEGVFGSGSTTKENSAVGIVKNLSEQTGTEIVGNLTGMRYDIREQHMTIREQLSVMNESVSIQRAIEANTAATVSNLGVVIGQLAGISSQLGDGQSSGREIGK